MSTLSLAEWPALFIIHHELADSIPDTSIFFNKLFIHHVRTFSSPFSLISAIGYLVDSETIKYFGSLLTDKKCYSEENKMLTLKLEIHVIIQSE